MRTIITFLSVLLLQGVLGVASAQTARVEYVRPLPVAGLQKLLGQDDQHLYVARKNGQVDALSTDSGLPVFSLQAKDDKGKRLIKEAVSVTVTDETIYVLDAGEDQILLYTRDGQFKGRIKGPGPASLDEPQGFTHAGGILYVADTGNRRIQLYSDTGVYLSSLPIDSSPENRKLDASKVPYRLESPVAVAVNPRGLIFVLDQGPGLVKIYAADGRYLMALPKQGKPVSLLLSSDGRAFVADSADYTVRRYDAAGKDAGLFGSRGDGRGQFTSLSGLAFDDGDIYIGDSRRAIVHHFRVPADQTVVPQLAALPPVVRVQDSLPLAANRLAWDGKETLVGVARGKKGVLLRMQKGKLAEQQMPKGFEPSALAFDKTGTLWALETDNEKLHKLDDLGNPVLTIGRGGSGNGQFDEPEDFAFTSDGSIYVADTGNSRIQGFSPDGVFFRVINRGLKDKLDEPSAVAVDARDNLYVLDKGRNAVTVYNAAGEPQVEFGNDKSKPLEMLQKPVGLMVTQEEIFVLSSERVSVYSQAGALLRTFAVSGKGMGELSAPRTIVPRDAGSFFIADGDNARVQLFSVAYRPRPPGAVQAAPAVHSVALNWETSPLAYVDHYAVYRAASENGPWERIGDSRQNSYVDKGLKPGSQFHYRVASAIAEGQEGAWSSVVSAAALKFTPPPPDAVQVEATPSSLRLVWKPMDLITGWKLYEKEGDKFKQIVETPTSELRREKLKAGTTYDYWLSAISVDGIESEKLAIKASTQADTRAPVEIDATALRSVFSNSYKLYEKDGVGSVRLTNNTETPIRDLKVSFVLNNFMDFPTEHRVPLLGPGSAVEVPLKAVFNNNILTLTEDTPVQAKLEASYFENGQPKTFSQVRTINIYDKHRMSWDEPRRYATFITPTDPLIVNFSRSVAAEFGAIKEPTLLAAAVFKTLGTMGLTYVPDPTSPYQQMSNNVASVDYIQYPRETLRRRTGDCDDLVGLLTAAFESLNITTRIVLVPGHMLLMLATGVPAPADGYTMDNMYVVHEGQLWIPVEATLIGKSFNQAWEEGAKTYYKFKGKEGFEIMDVRDAWEAYKPASLPDDNWRSPAVSRADIESRFPNELRSVLNISSQTRTRRYQQAIKKNPDDMDAHLQVGIVFARLGDRTEARKYFAKVVQSQPGNAAALNNLGNLYMLDGQYDLAQKYYADAAKADPSDAEILINLTKAHRASQNLDEAKTTYAQAQQLDASIANKYKALGLELANTLGSGQ